MLKTFILTALIFALTVMPATTATASDTHEYAPLQEKTINYKDWTYKGMKDGTPINLRRWAEGKKLVLVVYFAPWCGNWRMEVPVIDNLYKKYKAHGFDIVAVSEYGTRDQMRAFFDKQNVPYPVVVESETLIARDQTTHYTYRQATGDTRKWGSPYNIFLEPAKLAKDGEVLTEKAWIANGELIEREAEQFVRQRLSLDEQVKSQRVR